jgi:sensor histidine kinase regulating citrate/malate metabolism
MRNALEAGATKVIVDVSPEDGGAIITVRNNGPSLSPDVQSALYKMGTSTHRGDARHRGMGLCIAQRLMQNLGGTLDVDNAPEGGVIATLAIPDMGARS